MSVGGRNLRHDLLDVENEKFPKSGGHWVRSLAVPVTLVFEYINQLTKALYHIDQLSKTYIHGNA